MPTPLMLHPSVKGSLTICIPKVPHNGPKLGMGTIVLRISFGASDLSLSGVTHGIIMLWVSV
eukprot:3227567-Prorocentrum_lima.AAC.1